MTAPARELLPPPGRRDTPRSRKKHWPALDGLRALAALAVVTFHSSASGGPPVGRQGFIGVDVFFVLSGFLITSQLTAEHAATGTIRLTRFYSRRMLRLYPALLALCAFTAGLSLCYTNQAKTLLPAAAAAATYTSNFWIDTGHNGSTVLQTWTLALEEHFYLLWPPLLLVALAWNRRVVLAISSVILVGLLAAPVHGDLALVQSSYQKAVGLPMGCALAFYLNRRPAGWQPGRWWRTLGSASALCLLVVAMGPRMIPDGWFNGWFRLASILAVPVVLLLVTQVPRLLRPLAAKPLVWLGVRSYSLYIWHVPVLFTVVCFAPGEASPAVRLLIGWALSILAAALSYALIETPFLRMKDRLGGVAGTSRPKQARQSQRH